jgi:hypothetical protein
MDHVEFEQIVDRALKALPAPRAPHTLLPRVMAAVGMQMRPAARTWFTWRREWQIASVAALALLTIAVVWLATAAEAAVGARAAAALSQSSSIAIVAEGAAAIGELAHVAWETIQPVVCALLLFLLVMSTACAVFAMALGRVALGGAFQR